jgi:hypothetical protein
VSDIVVVTETRVDVVTVTGSGTTDAVQVTGDKQIEVLTMGVQGPQGPGSVLSPATTTTLGGVIVGDNLSINANGLLSAQAGGVTAFNGRVGNVSLTANDVSNVANGLYFPLNANVTSGNATITGPVSGTISNGTLTSRQIYGVSRAYLTTANAAIETYVGLDPNTASAGSVSVGTRSFNANSSSSSALQLSETRYTPSSAQTALEVRYANGTINRSVTYSASLSGAGLAYRDATTLSQIAVNSQGTVITGDLTSFIVSTKFTQTTYIPPANQTTGTIMNRRMCDERYAPFQKLN